MIIIIIAHGKSFVIFIEKLALDTYNVEYLENFIFACDKCGNCYFKSGNPRLAKDCLERGISAANSLLKEVQTVHARRVSAVIYKSAGNLYFSLKDNAKAKNYYDMAYSLFEKCFQSSIQ